MKSNQYFKRYEMPDHINPINPDRFNTIEYLRRNKVKVKSLYCKISDNQYFHLSTTER